MTLRNGTAILAVFLLCAPSLVGVASAETNKMGYQMETAEQAASLQRSGGSLGMRVGPKQTITSQGLTFQILKVEAVNGGSPAAQAGLSTGDQIIAVNGRVFPNTKTFAQYVGSFPPGKQINIDYMPAKGGPKDAQRVGVTIGKGGRASPAPQKAAPPTTTANTASNSAAGDADKGLSTGQKVAIGVGAAAILGCYEFDCYSKLKSRFGGGNQQKKAQPAPAQQAH